MKFYYSPSSCSLATRIILNELGFEFEEIAVNLKTKKTAVGDNYLLINSKGAVPALALDNGDLLTENQVIMQYLVDLAQDTTLLPPIGDIKRYHTLEWLNYVATEMHKTIGALFMPMVTEEMKTTVYLPMIAGRLRFVNEHLAQRDYLLGDSFSLPDAYLFVILSWTNYLNIDLSAYVNIIQFMKRVASRPSVVTSLQQEK